MDEEQMVRLVTEEVLRVLKQEGWVKNAAKSPIKIMAVFTGGMIGLPEVFGELQKLQAQGADLTAVLSPAAKMVIGIQAIQDKLGKEVPIITEVSSELYEVISNTDVVLVPILTQNSLAKVVHLICDTVATEVILRALQFGKKVIAVRNAADPLAPNRIQTGMAKPPEKLLHKIQDYLQQVQEYGVVLVEANNLATTAQQVFVTPSLATNQALFLSAANNLEPNSQASNAADKEAKTILDAAQIQQAISSGECKLAIRSGSLITPLAKDIAKEAGIEIVIADY